MEIVQFRFVPSHIWWGTRGEWMCRIGDWGVRFNGIYSALILHIYRIASNLSSLASQTSPPTALNWFARQVGNRINIIRLFRAHAAADAETLSPHILLSHSWVPSPFFVKREHHFVHKTQRPSHTQSRWCTCAARHTSAKRIAKIF